MMKRIMDLFVKRENVVDVMENIQDLGIKRTSQKMFSLEEGTWRFYIYTDEETFNRLIMSLHDSKVEVLPPQFKKEFEEEF